MSIASRITAIEEHIGDVYDTLELGGADLTNVNKNIVNISPTLEERYRNYMNNGTDDIWNNWTKTTGSGTDITLNNTIEAPMRITLSPSELSQSGTPTPSSPQDIHTISGDNTIRVLGKNLKDYTTSDFSPLLGWGLVSMSDSVNGIRTITLPSNASTLWRTFGFDTTEYLGKKMTLSFDAKVTSGSSTIWVESNTTGVYFQTYQCNLSSSFQRFSRTIDSVSNYFYIMAQSQDKTIQSTIEIKNICISLGENTTYEPYNDTDYSVNLKSKNLAFKGWAGDFISRINNSSVAYLEIRDNRLCLNYNANAGYNDYDNKYMFKTDWKENTQYTISCDIYSGSTTGNIRIVYTDNTSNNTTITSNTWTHLTLTSTANKTIKYITAYYMSGRTYIDLDTFMINEGTTALPYDEYYDYGEYSKISTYEDKFIRNSGKNKIKLDWLLSLCNPSYTTQVENGYTFFPLQSAYSTGQTLDTPINLPASISYKAKNGTGVNHRFRLWFDDGTSQTLTTGSGTGTSEVSVKIENITKSGATKITKVGMDWTTQGTFTITELMFNEGTTALDYEPYGSNEWYIKKNIGKVVLDGTENWGLYSASGSMPRRLGVQNNNLWFADSMPIISDYFHCGNKNSQTDLDMWTQVNYLAITDINSTWSTASDFKTWLTTHNTTVMYPLKTPTYTQITSETLIKQLNAIKKSYNNQTNISQENEDLPFEIDATALINIS